MLNHNHTPTALDPSHSAFSSEYTLKPCKHTITYIMITFSARKYGQKINLEVKKTNVNPVYTVQDAHGRDIKSDSLIAYFHCCPRRVLSLKSNRQFRQYHFFSNIQSRSMVFY